MNQPLVHAGYGRLELVAEAAVAVVRTLWKGCLAIRRAWRAARARDELHGLSERTLKDIGLSRGQIDALYR